MLKKSSISIAVLAALTASGASAGLHISPVVRDSVVIDLPSKNAPVNDEAQEQSQDNVKKAPVMQDKATEAALSGNRSYETSSIRGRSDRHGAFVISEEPSSAHKVFSYGENVPLFVALEKIVPESDDWKFNIEDGLSNSSVSWDGGSTWEGVLDAISEENELGISVNHADMTIGVAYDKHISEALSAKNAKIFRLNPEKTLRENLKEWARDSGYKQVVYSSEVYDVDYPVPEAVFVGEINVKGGALDQLLTALNKDADTPLAAEFKEANKIILISKKISKKEMY